MPTRHPSRRRSLVIGALGALLAIHAAATVLQPAAAADPTAEIVSAPLSPAESLAAIVVRPGLTVDLVAHEPLVVDPIALAWDAAARLWVVEMHDYPLGLDGQGKAGGRVKILSDDDGDGRYDRGTTFLDGLQFPTSVLPWRDGALVCAVPEIFFARDIDGDGRADERRTLYTGLHVGNPQHLANGLRFGLDGWVHCANGATKTPVKSVKTGQVVDVGTRDFRIRPDTGEIEPLAGRSQCLRDCDDFGNWFGNTNSNPLFQFVLEDRYLRRNPHASYPPVQRDVSVQPGAEMVYPVSRTVARFNDLSRANRFTSACSATIYRDELLGPEFYGNSFVCEPVHNLVHREVLTRDGPEFRSRKPDDEAGKEFLASRDNWFRPAMVRTGPDGALWIADMYRLVIEHPEWIPKEWQAKLNVRAGDDKGRIYRVRPTKLEPWPVPKLVDLTSEQLAAKLESTNGTLRDLAMQLLIERYGNEQDRSLEKGRAVEILIKQAAGSFRPAARLQSLATLALLGDELDTLTLRKALADSDKQVRIGALRLIDAEHFELDKQLLPDVIKLTDDADAQVRLQAACTVGDAADPKAAEALAKCLVRDGRSSWHLAAVTSSLTQQNLAQVTKPAVAECLAKSLNPQIVLAGLLDSALGWNERESVAELARCVVATKNAIARSDAAAVLLAGLARRRLSLSKFLEPRDAAQADAFASLQRIIDDARAEMRNPQTPEAERLHALALLGHDPARRAEELTLLAELLSPRSSEALQEAAIAALARLGDAASVDVLFTRWSGLAPRRKSQLLDACLARPAWSALLVDAIASKQIPAAEIDVTRAQQLLNHGDKSLREKARQALASSINADRKRVIDQFASALTLAGDPARGREAFTKTCANCHKLGDVGHAVGPDLAALTDKRPASLLTAVLDPNRAVESKYLAYTAETDAGLTFTGLLLAEGTNDVTIALADGKRQSVLRSELETLASTTKSFMPEGLEKDLNPQKLADIFALLGAVRAVPKTFAGNAPQVVRPEALRGEFFLLAENAEIYGPWLVYEPRYRNLGYWRSADDRAEWQLEVAAPGLYEVWLEYARPDDAGGDYLLSAGEQRLRGATTSTGGWDRYRNTRAGVVQLPAGRQRVVVQADGPIRHALFDLQHVRLRPKAQ